MLTGLLLLLVSLAMVAGGVWEVRQPDMPDDEDLFGDERYWTALFRYYGTVLIVLGCFGILVAVLLMTQS
ncbi:MAG: hypothetical protein AAF809_11010 [Bacteroidota bacterium]